jgi:hypothetical protein
MPECAGASTVHADGDPDRVRDPHVRDLPARDGPVDGGGAQPERPRALADARVADTAAGSRRLYQGCTKRRAKRGENGQMGTSPRRLESNGCRSLRGAAGYCTHGEADSGAEGHWFESSIARHSRGRDFHGFFHRVPAFTLALSGGLYCRCGALHHRVRELHPLARRASSPSVTAPTRTAPRPAPPSTADRS